ncbi:UvrD-helicase domain-containing protein [Methyloceanibacter sp.]|uniref:UvrD-helicase domain-containing protein n=1 Tax=Methyloceanibacter sp. TaxID=1965321 RepID=UPI002D2566FB|nr:UvrD-helicase domain-containing protein [Methyloceanibacter sp.]HZP10297.1 UvrD-helicase domain-containing protein [Methyloceanibacter sp.]
MSDRSVHDALRSEMELVVIEAPGGCGKTFQGAGYARDLISANRTQRLLILTHTHAACSVFDERTRGLASGVEIRTIDSLVVQIATAYRNGLGLPADPAAWARRNEDGYDLLAVKTAALLKRYPFIAKALACRYPVIICDEHQDSTGERHAIIMAIHAAGAKLRVFGDPMQRIYVTRQHIGGCPPLDWAALTREAHRFEELDHPHRWTSGSAELGQWILDARATLRRGEPIDLRQNRPMSVTVVRAENEAQGNLQYRPARGDRQLIDRFVGEDQRLLILTRYNETALSLRPAFNRRIVLWEGHVRAQLERFVDALTAAADRLAVAQAVAAFIQATCVGFTNNRFAKTFLQDVAEGCARHRRGRPEKIQALARMIVDEPNHKGAAKVLARLARLRAEDEDFQHIKIDALKEFHEGARLADFTSPQEGYAELSHRRAYTRPMPPDKAISTIHKAKGLEYHSVVVAPCDARTFRNDEISRCLFYVAISRAMSRLMLVVPRNDPSPLLVI